MTRNPFSQPRPGSVMAEPFGELMLPAAVVVLAGDWAAAPDGSWILDAELGLAPLRAAGFVPNSDGARDGARALSALASSVGGGLGQPSSCALALPSGHLLMALFDFGAQAVPDFDAAFRSRVRANAGRRLRGIAGWQPIPCDPVASPAGAVGAPRFGWLALARNENFLGAVRAALEASALDASAGGPSPRREAPRL